MLYLETSLAYDLHSNNMLTWYVNSKFSIYSKKSRSILSNKLRFDLNKCLINNDDCFISWYAKLLPSTLNDNFVKLEIEQYKK